MKTKLAKIKYSAKYPINRTELIESLKIIRRIHCDYLTGDDCVFEKAPLEQLVKEGQLMSYVHEGFWQCMDNIREKNMLEKLLETNTAPWKKWEREVPKSSIL